MNRKTAFVAAVLWIGMASSPFAAEEGAHRFRFERERQRRPAPRDAVRIDLPEPLRHPGGGTAVSPTPQPAPPTQPDPRAVRRYDELALAARQAAARVAERRAHAMGVRQYYRVGFWSGMRVALGDSRLGGWDHHEGARDGELDLEARRLGRETADIDADELARDASERQVVEQFSDLRNTIEFDPRPVAPEWQVPPLPLEYPSLAGVLDEFGFDSLPVVVRRGHLNGWSWGPEALRRCSTYADFYDGAWSDPTRAFELWRERGDSHWFHGLADPGERAWVARVFQESFNRWIAHFNETLLLAAHDEGFDEGWDYGAFARAELEYRSGYVEGFRNAARRAADKRFHQVYAGFYEDWYGHWHDEWNRNVKPSIGQIWLHDADRDGVFEPGERIDVEYELLNLGGAAGWAPLTVHSKVIRNADPVDVELPARGSVRRSDGVSLIIDPQTEPRTRSSLHFDLAGDRLDVPLRVAHPLEFDRRSIRVDRDNVGGFVRAEVIVENNGREPLEGRVTLDVHRAGRSESRSIGRLEGQSFAMLVFELEELDPLALIAGDLSLTFSARADGLEQDRYRNHLSDTVRDLGSRDLHVLLERMARDESTSAREIRSARELLMLRLREDWKVAAMGSGNPYKRDLRKGTASTALGDLVHAVQVSGRSLARSEVFAGLAGEVEELADSLPGRHPFLRRSMCKLARQLP